MLWQCCHLAVNSQQVCPQFGASSAAYWGTPLPSAWISCGHGSCRSQTERRPPRKIPGERTQQSAHSSRFWCLSAERGFPLAEKWLPLGKAVAHGNGPSRWCSPAWLRPSRSSLPATPWSLPPLTSTRRFPACLPERPPPVPPLGWGSGSDLCLRWIATFSQPNWSAACMAVLWKCWLGLWLPGMKMILCEGKAEKDVASCAIWIIIDFTQ